MNKITELDQQPTTLLDLSRLSSFVLEQDIKCILADNEITEFEISICCQNKYLVSDQELKFKTYITVPSEVDLISHIKSNFGTSVEVMAFVPKVSDTLLEQLEEKPIDGLFPCWQEDFISPYDQTFNRKLTDVVLESLDAAQLV